MFSTATKVLGMALAVLTIFVSHPEGRTQEGRVREGLKPDGWPYAVYGGVVSKVGPDWVELKSGWNGSELERPLWTEANKKTLRLSAKGTRAGDNPKGEGQTNTYRIVDLKAGDKIVIWPGSEDPNTGVIGSIEIRRRPGGKIPFMPGFNAPGYEVSRNQAEQDWEEKGIPIPKQFLGSEGRCTSTNPPYPPVAPHPREGMERRPIN